jgi:hypothetical protein
VVRFRVRVVASVKHAAQTVEWQRQARDVFEDVNRVLEPALGLHLDVESMRAWNAPADDDLDAALAALASDEPAGESDLVVGLVGGLPRLEASFHQVGRARVLGHHVVLRAAPPIGEHDDIEKNLDELKEEERSRLRRERRRHRASAVFLHELGHTLGAPHERDRATLMNPFYDAKMAGYGAEALELMRISIDRRVTSHDEGRALDLRELAGALADKLRVAAGPMTAERQEALAQLDALRAPGAGAGAGGGAAAARPSTAGASPGTSNAPPTPAAPAAPAVDLSGVSDADRATYDRAAELLRVGATNTAWDTARPLFAKYPKSYAVQDLRCQLAVLRRLDEKPLAQECAPMKRLSETR